MRRAAIPASEDKPKTTRRRFMMAVPMPWKLAVAFWCVALAFALAGFGLQQLGWDAVSSRLFAYMALSIVGFFVCWLCLAFINVNWLLGRRGMDDE